MEKISHSDWPEIVFGSSDTKVSHAINRAVRMGKLKKLAPRLYTSNLIDSPESIVRRHRFEILGHLFPEAVISHRSAIEGGVSKEGLIVLSYKYTKDVKLPGLLIKLIKGKPALGTDNQFINGLFIASEARALLENLQSSRERSGSVRKILPQAKIEERLEKICQINGADALNKIRDQARNVSAELGFNREMQKLDDLIGAILGRQEIKALESDKAIARAQGQPYDHARVELFAVLAAKLQREIFLKRNSVIKTESELLNFAFFEAYFSNFIEGTEFEIEEAEEIVFGNKIIESRSEDSHDILGTFKIISARVEMKKTPGSLDEFISLLQSRHLMLMQARTDKKPGEFKHIQNRVGSLTFVAPELVKGTLKKAFELYQHLPDGMAKAMFIMFVCAEIHPFLDGNGRVSRIMLNAELDFSNECRIIIPTVYREDYLLALRQLSNTGETSGYFNMLNRAQDFTASIDFSDYATALLQLKRCNAFSLASEAKLIINKKGSDRSSS